MSCSHGRSKPVGGWLAGGLLRGAAILPYQHANDGNEGDNLGEPPEGEEKATQHFGDGISVKARYKCDEKSVNERCSTS